MSHRVRLLFAVAAPILLCGVGASQRVRSIPAPMPPDIVGNSSIDVARISPDCYSVEFENRSVRVLRARLAPQVRVPTHAHPAGLLVALTAVRLRFATPDGRVTDLQVPPGQTRWLDREIHAEVNLAAEDCEFLVVEANPGSPIPYSVPQSPSPARR